MTRVSTAEMYDDKDVITQICQLKDGLNGALGGIISEVSVDENNDLVFTFADGSTTSVPLPDPTTGITSITGNVSGGNLTITFNFIGGTTHSFTCPLNGMASETYVDTKDAQNVKLTGAQSVAGVKTFTDSPIVPTTPTSPTGAVNDVYVNDATEGVNNIVHKDGGTKQEISLPIWITSQYLRIESPDKANTIPATSRNYGYYISDEDDRTVSSYYVRRYNNGDVEENIRATGLEQATPDGPITQYSGYIAYLCPFNDASNARVYITRQRSFDSANTQDVVTIGTLIEALQSYGLIS